VVVELTETYVAVLLQTLAIQLTQLQQLPVLQALTMQPLHQAVQAVAVHRQHHLNGMVHVLTADFHMAALVISVLQAEHSRTNITLILQVGDISVTIPIPIMVAEQAALFVVLPSILEEQPTHQLVQAVTPMVLHAKHVPVEASLTTTS
jgi:hypothetical protein